MRELSMFYKKRDVLLAVLSCVAVFAASPLKAQGLVSLSEEAMFDDGLETKPEAINAEVPLQKEDTKAPIAPKSGVATTATENQTASKDVSASNDTAKTIFDTNTSLQNNTETPAVDLFGSAGDENISGDLFQQMSDLEKRTALLNLELRREKLQNEIEAVKNQRRQALQQEQEQLEQQKLKNLEFEKEQEKKVLVEQQKLRDLDIKFETLRQEKLLNAYKNQMLEENQKWIENNASFYKQIADLRQSKKDLTEATKSKLQTLQKVALDARKDYQKIISRYKNEISNLQAQMNVLRNRIDLMETENQEMRKNPFAGVTASTSTTTSTLASAPSSKDETFDGEPTETDLSKLYAVTEIRGRGNELIAKLINRNGTAFYVKRGTALQSGHVIGDITTTYVTAEKDGESSYLYFSAGGIVPVETDSFEIQTPAQTSDGQNATGNGMTEQANVYTGGPVAGTL